MKNSRKFIVLISILFSVSLAAQPIGNIRGTVTDGASGQPLPYVTVVILHAEPVVGATTDENGQFRLTGLPVGRYDIQSSFMGYEPAVSKEIMVTSGKEVVLDMTMRENVSQLSEVVIRAKVNKEVTLNSMALAGGRMLSVEEANRYAGGFDDPARLVTAFAGAAGSTSSNSVSIRGNAPQFLSWRLEGVEAVNPTHFSEMTGIGGGILTAFSSQTLGNSDFFTGAFPAEYGNALAGVFDMQLRNGNNQNYEHAFQLGTLGIDAASEGPLGKNKQASYLFNYRYSSMGLAADLFPDLLAGAGGMRYQDLSFKLNFPTQKAGTFSVWGIGLKDHYTEGGDTDTTMWEDLYSHEAIFKQTKAMGGVGHKISIGGKSYLKSSAAAIYTKNDIYGENMFRDGSREPSTDMKNTNWNLTLETYLNTKFSASHTNRTGISATGLFYNLDYWGEEGLRNGVLSEMVHYAKSEGNTAAFSAFSQSSFRLSDQLTTNVGVYGTYFHLNKKASIEPRASIRYQILPNHAFSLAYGKHSRRENTDYYFVQTPKTGDEFVNKNLDFSKAHHIVLSYDWSISEHLRFKVEPYYQHLYDIPVEKGTTMSMVNYRDFWMMTPLVSEGKGKNYGVDLTLERYLHKGWYYLLTASLFESKYTGGDDEWRDTRLNRNIVVNALGGKEWKIKDKNILSVNLRLAFLGGERCTPVDEAATMAAHELIFDETHAFGEKLDPQVLAHFTVGYKMNRKKLAHT
ncbi:MAG: TonB-dependent receptor, partial [Bacteroidales bacterium]|nr:TonB-dependent receptor [Bacteroidales bacterium]